jgi:hypothetical protein
MDRMGILVVMVIDMTGLTGLTGWGFLVVMVID